MVCGRAGGPKFGVAVVGRWFGCCGGGEGGDGTCEEGVMVERENLYAGVEGFGGKFNVFETGWRGGEG